MDHNRVAIHELKAGLSRYLARVKAGEVIEITSHNKPIARLVGMPISAPPGIAQLLASGAASWSGGKPTPVPVQLPAARSGVKSLSEMVIEDRG